MERDFDERPSGQATDASREPRRGSMTCPVDGTELRLSERLGIEVDYCPRCRGVWLDRGEMDKIVERTVAEAGRADPGGYAPPSPQQPYPPTYYDRRDDHHYEHDYGHHGHHSYGGHHGRRRHHRSFLGELFDFD